MRVRFKDDRHLLPTALLRVIDVCAPVLQVKRMFKKHPGKKATESAESQSNSVQTAGKTDEAEGDLSCLFLRRSYRCGKQADEIVSQSLT